MDDNITSMRIRARRKELGITQPELAKKLHLAVSTIQKYENGYIANIKRSTIAEIADILMVSPVWLLGIDTDERIGNTNVVKVPILGKVAAGIPTDAIENIYDYEEMTAETAGTGEYFGLIINGDSMQPKMDSGDVVIARRQSDVDSGEIAVVLVNGDNATVKKVIKTEAGIILVSLNTAYKPMFFDNAQIADLPVTILGKVVELRAKF